MKSPISISRGRPHRMTGMMDEYKLYDPDGNLVDLGIDQDAVDERRSDIDWNERQWKIRLFRWEWRSRAG